MNKITRTMGMVAVMLGIGAHADAQEPQTAQNGEVKKEGFMKRAFRDMKESAKLQRQIDKANFKAQKMESKAFFEEQKAMRNPEVRKGVQQKEYQKQMAEAKARQEAAQKRIEEAKGNR